MAIYNFKKESKLHLVTDGNRYTLDIYPDYSISQTFDETSVPVKTLHEQFNVFEDAVINKANPANFSFTSPILLETDLNILWDLLINWDLNNIEASLKTADLYLQANTEVYKIEKAVFESGVFQISKDTPLLLNLSGTARKLSKFTGPIPGINQARSSTTTYTIPTSISVSLNSIVMPHITAITLELSNNVDWIDFATIQNSLEVNDASSTQYPEAFVVSSKVLSGTIEQYVTDETNANVNLWSTNSSLNIAVGSLGMSETLEFNIPSIVFTNRLNTQEIYTQGYDFRMNVNPSNLASVIIKNNI